MKLSIEQREEGQWNKDTTRISQFSHICYAYLANYAPTQNTLAHAM